MIAKGKENFDDVHAALSERLMVSKSTDGSFFQELVEAATTLSAPLLQEKIETTISRDGKRKTEVVEIGERVVTFKRFVEKEEATLKESWKQWEDLQTEYIELGVDVFGPEVFGEDAAYLKVKQKGFKREMELLGLEHDARVREFDEEIEETGPKILQKMKVSEKVQKASASCYLFMLISHRRWILPQRKSKQDYSKHSFRTKLSPGQGQISLIDLSQA